LCGPLYTQTDRQIDGRPEWQFIAWQKPRSRHLACKLYNVALTPSRGANGKRRRWSNSDCLR